MRARHENDYVTVFKENNSREHHYFYAVMHYDPRKEGYEMGGHGQLRTNPGDALTDAQRLSSVLQLELRTTPENGTARKR